MKQVIIFGAGGHGHVIADIVRAGGDTVLGFLDDDCEKNDEEILGPISSYPDYPDAEFVIGIGNSEVREKLASLPVKFYTAIHPSAIISPSAKIGCGTVVMPGAVINAESEIGMHCIINTGAIVEHNDIIEDYAHISVGARLGGTVKIGRSTWVGIGATVRNNISICDGCMIGAGAVVVRNITKKSTYIGVPARSFHLI